MRSVAASRSAKANKSRAPTTRAGARLSLPLTYGRPDINPETKITVTGFKSEINARKWVVAEAERVQA